MATTKTIEAIDNFDRLNFIDDRLVNKYKPDSQYQKSATKTIDETLNDQNPMVRDESVMPSENLDTKDISTSINLVDGSIAQVVSVRDEDKQVKSLLNVVI